MKRRNFIKVAAAGAACAALTTLNTKTGRAEPKNDADAFQPQTIKGRNFIDMSGREAVIAGYPVSWWDKHFGLPLHIHYAPVIRDNTKAFQEVFKKRYPKGEVRFAAKANPHPLVFSQVIKAGEGVDVASEYEAKGALLAGADPKHLDVNGNAKTDDFLRMAIGKDMVVICDSAEEFNLIAQLSKEMNAKPRVLQRLAGFSLGQATQAGSFTAGAWTKFGLNIKDINEFFPLPAKYPHIDFQGFHVHIGSPIASLKPYRIVAGKMAEFSKALADRGMPCKMFNIGGGYPVNYLDKKQWTTLLSRIRRGYEAAKANDPEKLWVWDNGAAGYQDELTGEIDLEHWSGVQFYSEHPKEKMLDDLLAGDIEVDGATTTFAKALKDLGEPTLVVEPGRSVVEDSGATLSRVAHVKKVDGVHDLIALEAGVVNFGDALEHTIPVNRWTLATDCGKKASAPFNAFIAGQLCFTGDLPSKYKIEFERRPERGDVLMTLDTGAYDPHFYAANTNAFPRPARVIVQENGDVDFLKTRDTLEEIYSLKG